MELKLCAGNYGKTRIGLPETRLVNAYIEQTPGGPNQAVRTTRPGLTLQYTVGTGPILGIYQQPGLFGGDVFIISGGELYRNNTLLGTIVYSQAPQMAGLDDQLAIVSGGTLYIYDGTTLNNQTTFDDGVSLLPPLLGVSVLYSIFIYPVVGQNGQFYFSQVGNPASIDAANFSSAQTANDNIVQTFVLAEEIYFFKDTSVEIWDYTGALTAPFALSQGRTYSRGCACQQSVRKLDNSLFWIGDDFVVYRTATVPHRISTSFIEGRIRTEAQFGQITLVTSLTYQIEGHVVYVINLPYLNESWAYDCQTAEFFQIGTLMGDGHDVSIFQGSYGTGQGNVPFVGSYSDGRVFLLDVTSNTDDGVPIQVVVSGAAWVIGGTHKNTNICLHNVRGVATMTTPDPIVQMRYSDDGGRTFTSWQQGSLGFVGTYRYKTIWRNLGIVRQPGRLCEFLISDPVIVAVEGASANESRP